MSKASDFFDGGGGGFVSSRFSGTKIASNSGGGVLFTLIPPLGERVRLNAFYQDANGELVTITRAGIVVINALRPEHQTKTANTFQVGSAGNDTSTDESAGFVREILGGIDEVIIASTTSGIGGNVYYSFDFGNIK